MASEKPNEIVAAGAARPMRAIPVSEKRRLNERSSMGVFTITQQSGGWIVFEDGRRVGGVVRQPFASREAAQA